MEKDLKSTVKTMGDVVNQEIYFVGGQIRTINDIPTASIQQGEYTTLKSGSGADWNIKTDKVDCIRVFSPKSNISIQTMYENRIYHFSGGRKVSIMWVVPQSEKIGEFTKFMDKDANMWLINRENVICYEKFLYFNIDKGYEKDHRSDTWADDRQSN